MSGRTGIEWTDRTWNPVVGCTKVSQGCKNCYAKTIHDMRHAAHLAGKKMAPQYAVPFEHVQLMPDRLTWPLSLRQPSRIFVNSVSDLFHEDVPDEFIDRVFAIMAMAPRHAFQVLTKRPERMLEYIGAPGLVGDIDGRSWRIREAGHAFGVAIADDVNFALPLPNVWLGVSVENQKAAEERIPLLQQTPAAVRFLSAEPLLGPIDFYGAGSRGGEDGDPFAFSALRGTDGVEPPIAGIDWVIVGGESGSSKQNPRPMHPDWARGIRDQCVAAGVPFLFKQWGDWTVCPLRHLPEDVEEVKHRRVGEQWMMRVGKKRAGRELDGRTWDEYPSPKEKLA
jgi:protein gp37